MVRDKSRAFEFALVIAAHIFSLTRRFKSKWGSPGFTCIASLSVFANFAAASASSTKNDAFVQMLYN
jgi:hypothetical protein